MIYPATPLACGGGCNAPKDVVKIRVEWVHRSYPSHTSDFLAWMRAWQNAFSPLRDACAGIWRLVRFLVDVNLYLVRLFDRPLAFRHVFVLLVLWPKIQFSAGSLGQRFTYAEIPY
jgi:hypothetical protein